MRYNNTKYLENLGRAREADMTNKLRKLIPSLILAFLVSVVVMPVWAQSEVKVANPKKGLSITEGRNGMLLVGGMTILTAAGLLAAGLTAPVAIPIGVAVAGIGYFGVKAGLNGIDAIQSHQEKTDRAIREATGEGYSETGSPAGGSLAGAANPYEDIDPAQVGR
jgi:hypothetical protein